MILRQIFPALILIVDMYTYWLNPISYCPTILQQHITTGETKDIMDQFPNELTELWRAPAKEENT
jgi:hypothetical protein